jgi:hypothetical protein
VWGGVRVHSALRPSIGLLCQSLVIMMMRNGWNDWQGTPKCSEKNYPSAALSCDCLFFFGIVGVGVQVGGLGTGATNRPIVPAAGEYDDVEIGRMIGKGNRSTRRKLAPVPLCPPQSPHAAGTRTRASAVCDCLTR